MRKNIKMQTILVVEDDASLKRIISLKLQEAGFKVVCVSDGREALAALGGGKNIPDLLWLDLYLPKMDGFEVLEWVRANPKTKNLRVIVVSVSGSGAKIKRAKSLGVAEYCIKSNYTIEDLIKRAKNLLAH